MSIIDVVESVNFTQHNTGLGKIGVGFQHLSNHLFCIYFKQTHFWFRFSHLVSYLYTGDAYLQNTVLILCYLYKTCEEQISEKLILRKMPVFGINKKTNV